MAQCANHPDQLAIEQCEVCGRALCGQCLWYDAAGQRLCQQHARAAEATGQTITPPHVYAEAIGASLVSSANAPPEPIEKARYRGNTADVQALLAAVLAVTVLLSCFGGGYCLPIGAVLLGAWGLLNLDKSADRERTRTLSLIGVGLGGTLMACLLLYLLCFFAYFVSVFVVGLSAP
ncbi:MAG: hypothetical protein ACRDHL_01965 [Candidatus Promineifilaceae bacterium]